MSQKTIVLNSQYMGHGNDQLGAKLMGNFLRKLWSLESKPRRILFYNSAVKLLADGSPALDALDQLDKAGVDLIACGTCVTHFDLKDKLRAGRVSDMGEIAGTLMNNGEVITV